MLSKITFRLVLHVPPGLFSSDAAFRRSRSQGSASPCLDLYQDGNALWFRPDFAFEKILRGEHLSLSEHLSIDDYDVMFYIKQWQNSDDKILS